MTALLINSPWIVIAVSALFYNGPEMLPVFVVSLVASAAAFYHTREKNYEPLGSALCLFCFFGAAAFLTRDTNSLDAVTSFVLYAALIVIVTEIKRTPKK